MKLSVLIPAFNEEKTIKEIVERALSELFLLKENKLLDDFEIIIVNDGSTDQTGIILNEEFSQFSRIKTLKHPKNKGKGAAIITALKLVSGDYILIQDADLEYNPKDYKALLLPVIRSNANVVYGSRLKANNIESFFQLIGNKILTWVSNFFSHFDLTDMETGYKLINFSLIKNLDLNNDDFRIEPEITAKLSHIKDVIIKEIPISYNPRTYSEGKKIRPKDALLALIYLIKFNLGKKLLKSHY
jgi:glycosyltransferase involved in cell wall biosynthesis